MIRKIKMIVCNSYSANLAFDMIPKKIYSSLYCIRKMKVVKLLVVLLNILPFSVGNYKNMN